MRGGLGMNCELSPCSLQVRHSVLSPLKGSAVYGRNHFADGSLHSYERRSSDDVVSDVQLFDGINLGNRRNITIGETMTGSHLQPELPGAVCTICYAQQLFFYPSRLCRAVRRR